jgi:hypothetical protein
LPRKLGAAEKCAPDGRDQRGHGGDESWQRSEEAEDKTLLAITLAVIAAPVVLRARRGRTCTAAHRLAPMRRDVALTVIVA